VQHAYSEGDPFFLDGQKPANVEVKLSGTTSTYRINVSIIR
jgi:hypothetical protein